MSETSLPPIDSCLGEGLTQRLAAVEAEQAALRATLATLTEEARHIRMLLHHYGVPTTEGAPTCPHPYPRHRRARGTTEAQVRHILETEGSQRVTDLVRRIHAVFGESANDTTVGTVLRRGELVGRYRRDRFRWSLGDA